MTFTASDPLREQQVNQFFQHHLLGGAGISLLDPTAFTWREWSALTLGPVGWIGSSQNVLSSLGTSLIENSMTDSGYVWRSGAEPGGWNFPNYTMAPEYLTGYTFDQNGNTEGWSLVNIPSSTPQGGIWQLSVPDPDPWMVSPTVSVDPFHAQFLRVDMASNSASDVGQVFWKRTTDSGFSQERSLPLTVRNDGAMHRYYVPMHEHPLWTGTIRQIRIDPTSSGASGETISIDRISFEYDGRMATTSAIYALAAWRYYSWTGNQWIFTSTNQTPQGSIFDRARLAVQFLMSQLDGSVSSSDLAKAHIILVPWAGHDGRPGKINGTLNKGHGLQSQHWIDNLPIGHESAHATVFYYAAVRALAELERVREAHPGWGVAANPFGYTAASLEAKASAIQDSLRNNFWLGGKGRLMACRDIDNVIRDPGLIPLNLEAIFYEAIDDFRADRVLEWLNGERQVSTDTSQGSDLYAWRLAPRVTTVPVDDWYIWPMYHWFGLNTAPGFGQQLANGGSSLHLTFFDIWSRIRHRGADNAWSRFVAVLDWFQETQNAGGYDAYYNVHPGTPQCTLDPSEGIGTLGVNCEFPESVLAPLSFLYGFLGITATAENLTIDPALPADLTYAGVQRLFFRQHFYDVTVFRDAMSPVRIATHAGPDLPLPNAPHALPIRIGGLQPNSSYSLEVTNLDLGSTTVGSVASSIDGFLELAISMPANAQFVLRKGQENAIFSDDFESGDLFAWALVSN